MHLPLGLTKWIRAGTLAREVESAYAQLDALGAGLDAWEARNPEAAKLEPWYQAREAWKAAGRPKLHWIEALKWRKTQHAYAPVGISEIEKDLLMLHVKPYRARRKARGEACTAGEGITAATVSVGGTFI